MICAKSDAPARPAARAPRQPRSRTGAARPNARAATGLKVRRVTRAADDGFESELVPGLRATEDALRLADELAFSEARLAELRAAPPGLYAEVAAAPDAEEACWLAFLIAYLCPLSIPAAFDGITAARVSWASGELPDIDGAALGPRSGHDPGRGTATVLAYRSWAARTGSQYAGLLGDREWEPERRFVRTFERLALPCLHRGARFELLTSLGALGVVPIEAGTMALAAADPSDAVALAAKRVLGIGDAINLERRAAALADGVGVPPAALDLALHNWSQPGEDRATMGATVGADEDRRGAIAAALGAL